ncbi:MAG: tagatose 1,6-diphosphate aldolase [Candidatus Paceibacterota bacterium]
MSRENKKIGIAKLSDKKGKLKILALDHEDTFRNSIIEKSGVKEVTNADFFKTKKLIISILCKEISGILLDPDAYIKLKKSIPDDLGVLLKLEGGYSLNKEVERVTKFNSKWPIDKISKTGAVGVKFMVYYHPDASEETKEKQRKIAREAGELCEKYNLLYVLEPMGYVLCDKNLEKSKVDLIRAKEKLHVVFESVLEFSKPEYKADILKIEFPAKLGYTDLYNDGAFGSTKEGYFYTVEEIRRCCRKIDSIAKCPWIIMSSGASNSEFAEYVRLAGNAGASGYLGGQGIWKSSLSNFPNYKSMKKSLETEGIRNIRRVNDILDNETSQNSLLTGRYRNIKYKSDLSDSLKNILPEDWLDSLLGKTDKYLGFTETIPATVSLAFLDKKIIKIGEPNKNNSSFLEILKKKLPKNKKLVLATVFEPDVSESEKIISLLKKQNIKFVVFGSLHPDIKLKGKLKSKLEKEDINVYVAGCEDIVSQEDRRFWVWASKKRPYINLKISLTSDGAAVINSGEPTRLAGYLSNARIHTLRGQYDALLIGANTVMNDNPKMTYRGNHHYKNPKKIVLSSTKLDKKLEIFKGENPLLCSGDLNKLVKDWASKNITSVLVEGGVEVFREFIDHNLVDEISIVWTKKSSGKNPIYLERRLPSGNLEIVGNDIWEIVKWNIVQLHNVKNK